MGRAHSCSGLRIHWRLLLSRHSGFCRLLLSRCRCSGGRTRALAPLNALVHALLAEAVSCHVNAGVCEIGIRQRTRLSGLCVDSRRLSVSSAGSTLPGGCKRRGPNLGRAAAAQTRHSFVRSWVAPLLCVCTKVARSWVARPRLACPGCRRSTSGLVRSQCRTSWPSPSERSPNPGASARGSS